MQEHLIQLWNESPLGSQIFEIGKGWDIKFFSVTKSLNKLTIKTREFPLHSIYEYKKYEFKYYEPMTRCSICHDWIYYLYVISYSTLCEVCYDSYSLYLFSKLIKPMMLLHRLINENIITLDVYNIIITFLCYIPL